MMCKCYNVAPTWQVKGEMLKLFDEEKCKAIDHMNAFGYIGTDLAFDYIGTT